MAKILDVDISMFKYSLLSALERNIELTGGTCKRDRDCNYNFLNCLGECNLATGVCTGRLKSSNLVVSNLHNMLNVCACLKTHITKLFLLQTMCRDLFSKMYPLHPNLLYNPPASITDFLSEVLKECSKPGPSQIDWDLFIQTTQINPVE